MKFSCFKKLGLDFDMLIEELFGSIKTTMVEYFDERYAALAETAAAAATSAVTAAGVGGGAGRAFQYRDFNNTKPRHLMVHRMRSGLCGGCLM